MCEHVLNTIDYLPPTIMYKVLTDDRDDTTLNGPYYTARDYKGHNVPWESRYILKQTCNKHGLSNGTCGLHAFKEAWAARALSYCWRSPQMRIVKVIGWGLTQEFDRGYSTEFMILA